MATDQRRIDAAQELFDLWHAIRRVTAARFNDYGVSFPRAKVLWALAEAGPLRASALADQLDCSGATATELVDALVRDGLAVRSPDPKDRRAVLIDITPAGREVAAEAKAHKRSVLDDVFGTLSTAEVENLTALLHQLASSPTLKEATA